MQQVSSAHKRYQDLPDTSDSSEAEATLITLQTTPEAPTSAEVQTPNDSVLEMDSQNALDFNSVSTLQNTNTAPRANIIAADFDEANIILQRTRRKAAHAVALTQGSELVVYHSAFTSQLSDKSLAKQCPSPAELPLPPKSWRQMLKHPHAEGFKIAAQKEYNDLFAKGTFELQSKAQMDPQQLTNQLPLIWRFIYKFDDNSSLLKYKARLCARGDLYSESGDTYAATLAAQTFRVFMALVAAFDLNLEQYDAVNAFVNAPLDEPIICHALEGFQALDRVFKLKKALYRLKISLLL